LSGCRRCSRKWSNPSWHQAVAQYEQGEKALLDAKGEFEAFRAATQRKLARRESEMFKVIYADTTSMVKKYAEFAKFTVVIRFDRKDINDETAPSEAVQRMNKQVVYYRGEDDITDVVLQTLNKQYEQSSGVHRVAPVKGTSLSTRPVLGQPATRLVARLRILIRPRNC
jgi:hypothetical protein